MDTDPGPAVLVVDDDPASRLLARTALTQSGFTVHEAENGAAALDVFAVRRIDLVLLDVVMPEMDGFACCQALRARSSGALVPILMMTGLDDIESIDRAYDAGATDFVTKPINYAILTHRIRYMLRAARMAGELRIAEQQTHRLTYFDSATGLPNRLWLNERLEQSLRLACRHDRRLALLAVDIDNFGRVNESLGTRSGDALLKEIADRIASCIRATDLSGGTEAVAESQRLVARIEGDEFIVVLTDIVSVEDAAVVAHRLRRAVAQPVNIDGNEIVLTACIGISACPEDGADPELLLKRASAALTHAKSEGRNSYQFYTAELNSRAFERLTLEAELRRALEDDQFAVYFQPKVSVIGQRVTGVEALIRWRHPELGVISPIKFIPIAEETGLIMPLGEWVLRRACMHVGAWSAQGLYELSVAVNLSASQFKGTDLVGLVSRVLEEANLSADRLELELTESVLLADAGRSVELLDRLHEIGVSVSIDDFGTGYSSLSYLKRLPISGLKIDRSFVRDIETDADDAMIVAAIIGLANNLRLKVIAEGVENRGQLRVLEAHGCDEVQGYYYTPPLPADEFIAWMRARDTVVMRDSATVA